MKRFYLLIVLTVFAANACQSTQTAANKNANKETVVANRPIQDKQVAWGQEQNAKLGIQQAKYYPGTGVITEIRKNTGEVEIDHEEIKGKMPAMKMMFHVKEKEWLQPLKVGDEVNFVLEDDAGREILSSIGKKPSLK